MKAVRLNEVGGPGNLRLEMVADPVPGPHQVLVKIKRAALNRRDLFITQGRYPGVQVPCTLGSDGAGEIVGVGNAVAGLRTGASVLIDPQLFWSDDPAELQAFGGGKILGMPTDGTFAEYVAVPEQNVFAQPRGLNADEAAALPLAGLTAYRAVFTRGRVTPQDTVLITGIGGGVQTLVLLFVKHAGARAIVTSRSDEKLAKAKALGADTGINSGNPDWYKQARKASDGVGPTLVVDATGGQTLAHALDIAAPSARVVLYGATAGEANIRPSSIFWKQLTVMGTSMGSPADFAEMLALFETGLKPVVDRVYPIERAADAFERLAKAEQFGKVVLAVA